MAFAEESTKNSLLVAPYHFGLIAMFFVVCFTPGIELIQIGFIKFDNHFRPFLSAKIAANFYIRKLSNTLFLYKENPHFAVWKTFGTFGAILKPNTQKAHGSARLD